jgi:S1-C subfamily serine protease
MRTSISHVASIVFVFLMMTSCQTTRYDPYARPTPATRYDRQTQQNSQTRSATTSPSSSTARTVEAPRPGLFKEGLTPPRQPRQARQWTDVIANVVLIDVELANEETLMERTSRSSGLLLPGGWVVSTLHGMRDAETIEIHYRGTKHRASVVYQDPALDLALLVFTLTHNDQDLLTDVGGVSFNLSPSLGMRIFCIGYPYLENVKDDQPSISGGIIGAMQRSLERGNGHLRTGLIQLDAVATVGNSGGPTIDQEGRIIGLTGYIIDTHGIWSGATFLIPAAQVVDFLQRHGIPAEVN